MIPVREASLDSTLPGPRPVRVLDARSGIDAVDSLRGATVTVIDSGVDSDLAVYVIVQTDDDEVFTLYRDQIEFEALV
jgi:hypothetical protein